jgi:hypothetical protein
VLPVIVFTSQLPAAEVDKIYDARAACVVEIPNELESLTMAIQSLKNFWVHQARLPFCNELPVRSASAG